MCFVIVAFLAGCSPEPTSSTASPGGACGSGIECPEGQTCVDGECLKVCAQRNQCDGDCCVDDVCQPCKQSGAECAGNEECATATCRDGKCMDPGCNDGVRNGSETDKDCGGGCPGCSPGQSCLVASDCASGVCTDQACQEPKCSDGVTNGAEACDDGGDSATCDADCTPQRCGDGYINEAANEECDDDNNVDDDDCSNACDKARCNDEKRNANETAVDCGGGCEPCTAGQACITNSDCLTGHCTEDQVCDYLGSCLEILAADRNAASGPYSIDIDGLQGPEQPISVYCDMDTNGGGWTLGLNLNTSDGHVMWWSNPRWLDRTTLGSASEPFATDHKSSAWSTFADATRVLLAVHKNGDIVGWKSFRKADGKTLHELMQGKDNTPLADAALAQDTRDIWHGEWLVRRSTQLFANHCEQNNGESCVRDSPLEGSASDGDRIGSHEATPDQNEGGGLGNWHDMGYCCSSETSSVLGHICNDESIRTASEAQAGWAAWYQEPETGGYFGTDAYVPPGEPGAQGSNTCSTTNTANWAEENGIEYDYALYLREDACANDMRDGTETDTDCGGTCKGCPSGSACVTHGDCLSGECDGGTCAAEYRLTCQDLLYAHPDLPDGVYRIDPDGSGENMAAFQVYCDMSTRGGGWTVVEKSPHEDPVGLGLYSDFPVNQQDPQARRHRLLRTQMESLQARSDELLIHCGGRDYLKTDASYLFDGEGGPGDCFNRGLVHYEEASLRGNTLRDTRLCTWFIGATEGCAGAFHIDEHAQDYCGLADYPWADEAITDPSTDAFAPGGNTLDPRTNCHEPGAVRYVMLRDKCVENGVSDGTETGVDCGGSCEGCAPGKSCNSGNDCITGVCENGQCGAPLKSCADILAVNPEAKDGQYLLDYDGSGTAAPLARHCDMSTDGGGWTRVAYEDFESETTAWNKNSITSCGIFGEILGGYNVLAGEANTKLYDMQGLAHTRARIELDFIQIDTWDNESAYVRVDGNEVWVDAFSGAVGGQICGNGGADELHHVNETVEHDANALELTVGATVNQAPTDESWGIDNVEIYIR